MDEKTVDTEDIDTQIAALRAKQKRVRLLAVQREKYRPQLAAAHDRIAEQVKPLVDRAAEITNAIAEIDRGEITEYRLRAKPVRKAKP